MTTKSDDGSGDGGAEEGQQNKQPPAEKPPLFIIPSYASSGSHFARALVALALHGGTGTLYAAKGLYETFEVGLKIFYDPHYEHPDVGGPGKPLLVKTHFPSIFSPGQDRFFNEGLMSNGRFKGIVQLVRNPGDCLLRNSARWGCKSARNKTDCRAKHEKQNCGTLGPSLWLKHQRFWLDLAERQSVPWFALRYEDLLIEPRATVNRLLKFANVSAEVLANLDFTSERVVQVLGEDRPKTSQVDVLGKAMLNRGCPLTARQKLHEQTRVVARKLGYDFDAKEGVWTLAADRWANFE